MLPSQRVRMAEWSKAPDSRCLPSPRAFWSPNGGVGSNPTSDRRVFATFRERIQEHFPLRPVVLFCFVSETAAIFRLYVASVHHYLFSSALQRPRDRSGGRGRLFKYRRFKQPHSATLFTSHFLVCLAYCRGLSYVFPGGLVVRIRRSHRRGPGSIPGQGKRLFFLST